MKKTNATLLTAAMFAAAANLVPGSGAAASELLGSNAVIAENVQADQEAINTYVTLYGPPWAFKTTSLDLTEETTTIEMPRTQPMYGPPIYMDTTTVSVPDETEPIVQSLKTQPAYGAPIYFETDIPEVIETTTTRTTMAPLYGSPWVLTTTPYTTTEDIYDTPQTEYGPPMLKRGDLITDGVVNAFDLAEAKRALVTNDEEYDFNKLMAADFNRDGYFSMADIIGLNRFLLGDKEGYNERIDDEGNPIVTTTTLPEDEDINNHTSQTTTVAVPIPTLYGPPLAYGK